jgi:hypothetical protein
MGYVGDGWCDDGVWGVNLVCEEFNFDNGDCDDECGEPLGDGSSCADECGVPNGDNSSCADYCGIPNGPNLANECEEEEAGCVDCAGQDCTGYEGWIGDGYCDDGSWGLYFNCDEFDCDAGDCDCGGDSGDGGGYPDTDCSGQSYAGYESWIGDGYCDDGAWGYYFNCDEFNNDEGDCDRSDDQDIEDGFRAKKDAYIANMEAKDYYVTPDNRDGECGGTGPDVDCAGDCFGDAAEDCAGECDGSAAEDECGICNGSGIADGACDCDGNVLDGVGACGGSADFGVSLQSQSQSFYNFSSATIDGVELDSDDLLVGYTEDGVFVGWSTWNGPGTDVAVRVNTHYSDICSWTIPSAPTNKYTILCVSHK